LMYLSPQDYSSSQRSGQASNLANLALMPEVRAFGLRFVGTTPQSWFLADGGNKKEDCDECSSRRLQRTWVNGLGSGRLMLDEVNCNLATSKLGQGSQCSGVERARLEIRRATSLGEVGRGDGETQKVGLSINAVGPWPAWSESFLVALF
jgi:hypothetical protein